MNKDNIQDDNVVSYILYPCKTLTNLNDLINNYVAYLNSEFQLHYYIWQHDCIRFWVSKDISLPQICGWIKYGHNIEDEWLTVFLLLELTKKYDDLIIRVYDDDGEFLLIETADVLPKWLNPETGENKVFLFRGHLHILPKAFATKSLSEGLNYIFKNFDKTLASDEIQKVLQKRISGYPKNITQLMHNTHCFLPENLAIILNLQPILVSHIVEAYCLKDGIDTKSCIDPKFFFTENLIKRMVKFNRCLYAQLMHSKFFTHTKSKFKIPVKSSHPEFLPYELGLKLAIGAEILCVQGMKYKKSANINHVNANDTKWMQFIGSLKNSGYFKQEYEGSKEYCKLLEAAKLFFKNSVDLNEGDLEIHPGVKILDILNNINYEDEILKIKNYELLLPDNDNWLDIGPDDLDNMLSEMFPKQRVSNLENLAPTVDKFIQKKSKFDGLDVTSSNNSSINLEPDKFFNSIKSLLDDNKEDSVSTDDDDEEDSDDNCSPEYDSDDYLPGYDVENKDNKLSEIEEYMIEMDRQLAATEIGKSFLKMKCSSNSIRNKASLIDDFSAPSEISGSHIDKITQEENNQLNSLDNGIDSDFNSNKSNNEAKHLSENTNLNDNNFDALDVDYNLVSNFLDSYSEQCGLPGPVSNILNGLGLRLPFE